MEKVSKTGYGDGSGDGDGYDVLSCTPANVSVSEKDLLAKSACRDQVAKFKALFPDGATWPSDIAKAQAAGLDISWARINLGLLMPK